MSLDTMHFHLVPLIDCMNHVFIPNLISDLPAMNTQTWTRSICYLADIFKNIAMPDVRL